MKSIVMLFCLSSAMVYATELYTWTDEDGNVQYSQTPPPPEVSVTTKTLPTLPEIEKATVANEKEVEKKTEITDTIAATIQDENCQQAQEHLQMLNANAGKLVIRDKDNPNNFKEMSQEERQQEVERTQGYFDTYCQKKSDVSSTAAETETME